MCDQINGGRGGMENLFLQLTALVAGICAVWLAQSLSKKRLSGPSKKKTDARRHYAKGVQLLARASSSSSAAAAAEARSLAKDAAAEADAAIALDPCNAAPFYILKALALEQQGLVQGAIRSLDAAINSPETSTSLSLPEMADALAKRGSLLLLTRKNMNAAITDLCQSLEIVPDNPEVLCTLARCYEKSKRFVDAEKTYQQAFALDPKSEDAWAGLKRLRP